MNNNNIELVVLFLQPDISVVYLYNVGYEQIQIMTK